MSAHPQVLPYVHERKQFGQAIGGFQLMQGKLGDMYAIMSAAKSQCLGGNGYTSEIRRMLIGRELFKETA